MLLRTAATTALRRPLPLLRPCTAPAPPTLTPSLTPARTKFYKAHEYLTPIVPRDTQDFALANEELRAKLKYSKILPLPHTVHMGLHYHPRVQAFTNYLMLKLNKALANELMKRTFHTIKVTQLKAWREAATEEERAAVQLDPLAVFLGAVENSRPIMTTLAIRKGGIKYQVPMPLKEKLSYFRGMKWLVEAGRDRPHWTVHFPEQMAKELIDAYHGRGRVVQKKIDLHKLCEANKAFAHYRKRA